MVGVAAAKALAVGLGKPIYGVNHLAAHVAVDQLEHGPLPEPCLAMLVSGGHSSLLRVTDVTVGVDPLGATIDDAAGEAFDKVARLLGLPFPGGPHIDRVAREGTACTIDFPRGLTSRRDLERHRFDFSFSGLKTAVARWVEARERSGEPVPVADVAASFQEAVCDVLDPQGDRRGGRRGHRGHPHRRRRRRELTAARAWPRSAPPRAASGCGCRAPACAPTTARWSPPSAPRWSPAAVRRPPSTSPPTPRMPVTTVVA